LWQQQRSIWHEILQQNLGDCVIVSGIDARLEEIPRTRWERGWVSGRNMYICHLFGEDLGTTENARVVDWSMLDSYTTALPLPSWMHEAPDRAYRPCTCGAAGRARGTSCNGIRALNSRGADDRQRIVGNRTAGPLKWSAFDVRHESAMLLRTALR
jgi:hypothetical protein